MKRLVLLRRTVQCCFLALVIYILWSMTYPLKSAISSQALFIMDPLIMGLTSLSERLFLPGLVFSGAMLLLTLLLGRFFCGWVCPMGAVIDMAGALTRRRGALSLQDKRGLRWPKFMVLALVCILALIGIQAAWVFDPIVMFARVISFNVIPTVTLAVDRAFQWCIQHFGLYGGFYDLYRTLKEGFLGVNVHFFANALDTWMFFLVILLSTALILRLWCRMLCPLGACYALAAIPSLLQRHVSRCTSCGHCARQCRMGAIEQGMSYRKEECILCMDCVYHCPERSTRFVFRPMDVKPLDKANNKGLTRAQFLCFMGAAFTALGVKDKALAGSSVPAVHPVIRPPGALPEDRFVNTCVRCGNCMKVCITGVLQPVMFEAGPKGVWTPRMVPQVGYCEYNCKLCGEVCPTGAIKAMPLEVKKAWKVGLARIDQGICISWKGQKECMVCEEHCPIPDKAIKMREEVFEGKKMLRPYVAKDRCNGCGICQNKCPVGPSQAIWVDPRIVE
jgi:MauM/NapG family ferredoxin protein